ncbi:ligand-effect modulator 3 family [Fimicolochytrium jonesii]|uniref:ligand-effect modulator 3 family n=1 Tax=Fimicolochytrium jonesii TaxID=1396493 RepID=UPI0022FDD6A9|nr:ligand-effect modulator 3 family [Fimicolochytrium jonesii]KAI8819048.1 ligand-effect modulator 3 family [Fimicolochytrium jonesii]
MSDSVKSKKPANTAFKQQRLKAWQPILTPKTVLPTFFLVGAIFVPLGIGLYIASEKVKELMFDYTDCQSGGTPSAPITNWSWNAANKTCTIDFKVDEAFNPPVFMYYRLTNFYQNHRRYVKSFDAEQLKGSQTTPSGKGLDLCDPLKTPPQGTTVRINGQDVAVSPNAQYYPCGLIANSMFSDEISNLTSISAAQPSGGTYVDYTFTENGISWPSDKDRFKQSTWLDKPDDELLRTLIPPPFWAEAWPEKYAHGYTRDTIPNINTWERFQVWMRTAALPTFRKLWGRNENTALMPGVWRITIRDTFGVQKFGGRKAIVLSTVSLLGGKNPFLGSAYIAVGVISWILGLVFLFRHMIKPRKLGDHTYLSWNQPQQNAGAAPQRMPEVGGERSSLMHR